MNSVPARETWSSRWTFLIATIGSAVGLGNLWRFPYIAGENGGGAFVIVYLVLALLVGVPLVMAELAIARRGRHNPLTTMQAVCAEQGAARVWHGIGWFSVISPTIALSFYSVVAAWSLDYLVKSVLGVFTGVDGAGAQRIFDALLASPLRLMLWHAVFIGGVIFVVGRGVRRGIERASDVLMPALFVLLLALVLYANLVGAAGAGWRFLFAPDFSSLTPKAVLMALGQMLFSVSVGTGALLTYGGYLPGEARIAGAAWTLVLADTAVAVLAGLAIFPIVFAAGLDPAEGPGLSFVVLPVAFGHMPGGSAFAAMFFLLVFFAAITSAFAMLEPMVSLLVERGARRRRAALGLGTLAWLLGLASVFSFNLWRDFQPFAGVPLLRGRTVFSLLDFCVSNLMLPITALLIALFAGWVMRPDAMREELADLGTGGFALWRVLVRYLAPVAVAAVFVFNFVAA
ncbi:MAG: sodium-dependent transporter [Gammaproteobacteria bacterium]|nr:sodium-dependent transporter [Gammaproteobacteria bacterium]